MSIITHKYMPEQIPESELEATFAARNDVLDYLMDAIRAQVNKETLSSYIILGPRGSGKTTIIRMVRLRLAKDQELDAAWLVVPFPEEQFNVASLRDLFAFALEILAREGIEPAALWLQKVEEEEDEEQSCQLAITGLREVAREQGKRLVLFIENLNLLFDSALNDESKGTLRRLLMIEPFMFIVGSAVHMFDSLRKYDEAFFNYFCPVRLDRLNDEQVFDLLCRRAEFEENDTFLREFRRYQSKIRAITHLSGGNPRLILMLYELLSQRKVLTVVQQLRRLIDELTPLLKDELEGLPTQQRKIIHALMEKGGTAKPSDLTGPTRLSLNTLTTQLRRLKEAQILDLRGGGKGHPAYYTAPDQLFAIWYQMRYLRQHKRRIELFIEVLRLWFEAEDRFQTVKSLCSSLGEGEGGDRDAASTAEYFAESLSGTQYELPARELALKQWMRVGDLRETALAYAEFEHLPMKGERAYESQAYSAFGEYIRERGDTETALEAFQRAAEQSRDPNDIFKYGNALSRQGRYSEAVTQFEKVIQSTQIEMQLQAQALIELGLAKGQQGDLAEAIMDFTTVVELEGVSTTMVALALCNRSFFKEQLNDLAGSIEDSTAAIELEGVPTEVIANALVNRGTSKRRQYDMPGAISDFTAVIELEGISAEIVALAFIERGYAKWQQNDLTGSIEDSTAVIELKGASARVIAHALVNRGVSKGQQGDIKGAIWDYTEVIELKGAPTETVAWAMFFRGCEKVNQSDLVGAILDYSSVQEMPDAPAEIRRGSTQNLFIISWMNGKRNEALASITRFVGSISTGLLEEQKQMMIELLEDLALPSLKEAWPQALKAALGDQSLEIVDALKFFIPVADVLEGADRSVLDALPPEQREFAQKVLAKFEPEQQ